VEDGLRRALRAATLLNQAALDAPGEFSTQEVLFRFPDRLHLVNDDASFASVRPAIEAALEALIGGTTFSLAREDEPRAPLTVRASS
jgi:hypothetical protein